MNNNLILLMDGGEGSPAPEYLVLTANGYVLARPGAAAVAGSGAIRAVIADAAAGPVPALVKKAAEQAPGAPVLAVLPDAQPARREQTLAEGAGDCICRPFRPGELLARVKAMATPPASAAGEALARALDGSAIALIIHARGRFLHVNAAAAKMLHAPSSYALTGTSVLDRIHPDFRASAEARAKAGGDEPSLMEEKLLAVDGTVVNIQSARVCLQYQGENAIFLLAQDAGCRGRKENEPESLEDWCRAIFNQPGNMFLLEVFPDRSPVILDANEAAALAHGYTRKEMVGMSVSILDPDSADSVQRRKEYMEKGTANFIVRHRRKDGTEFTAEVNMTAIDSGGRRLAVAFERDITETRRIEESVYTAQKFESLGLLAGGIAHDFNNMLTCVMGNLSLIKNLSPGNRDIAEMTDEATEACTEARALAWQLLTFASGGAPSLEAVEIGPLLHKAAKFAAHGSKSRLKVDAPDGLTAVADRNQITQVIQNLVINAAQAMPEGGQITVRAAADDGSGARLEPGSYVRIDVTDTGKGIPPEVLPRIYDPYFSTKGKGRGLGLSVCRSIIKKHGGDIMARSEAGRGTTFSFFLRTSAAHGEARPQAAARPAAKLAGRRILVMDDEKTVQGVLVRLLKELGCEAAVTADGNHALAAYEKAKRAGRPFDAVILDLTIPGGMGGEKTLKGLLNLDPAVKAVVTTGYGNDPAVKAFRQHGFAAALMKPFQLEDVAAALSTALEA